MNTHSHFDEESIGDRLAIVQETVDLYLSDEASFSVYNLADRMEVEPSDIYSYYPNKRAILLDYYVLVIDRYQIMINEIEDFKHYDLAEKLSNFIYTSFDLMNENREFVEETFQSLIIDNGHGQHFDQRLKQLLKQFFKQDSNIATSNQLLMQDIFYEFLISQYQYLVEFWLQDGSPEREKSMAYTDKLTTFLQEIMYTSIIDKGIDLLKFMISNDHRFKRIPIIGSISRKIIKSL